MLTEGYKHHDAVTDAMMCAQEYFYRDASCMPLFQLKSKRDPIDVAEDVLRHGSLSKCSRGSLLAISHLQRNFPDYFEYLFLMTLDNRGQYYGEIPSLLDGFQFHTVFLAKSIDNMWFAGSPANFETDRMRNYMTDLMYRNDLNELIADIKLRTPGPWPQADVIEEKLQDYQPPELVDGIEIALYHSHLQRIMGNDFFEFTPRSRPVGQDKYNFNRS